MKHRAGLKNTGTNGELSHVQGHEDDGFHVSDVDLASDVQSATGASLDNISSAVASRGFDRDDFIWPCTHRRCQVLEHVVPTVDKPLGVNAGEKACQVLVVQSWKVDGVGVNVLKCLDEFKTWARLGGKADGMSWNRTLAIQLSIGLKGEVKKLTIGRPDVNLFLPLRADVGIGEVTACSQSPRVVLQESSFDLLYCEVDGVDR